MYNPGQSSYGGYGDYWGGYGRPPVPPPMPPVPPSNHSPYHPLSAPMPYRQIRTLPHTFRPPPPPPPPPDRLQNSEENDQSVYQDPELTPRVSYSDEEDIHSDHSESGPSNIPSEPLIGTPLVPRGKETQSSSYGRPSKRPRNKEKDTSATPSAPVYKRPLPVELDPNLPPELVSLLHNNHCELCNVKLNSRIQSKNHYEGKPHKKKVKHFILENGRKEGESAAKIPKIDVSSSKKKSDTVDVSQLYCKCCDLSFTSEQHAQQHYMGRNHQRILHGLKPLKAGYYNKDTGKWQRAPPDPRVAVERIGLNCERSSDSESEGSKKADEATAKEKERFFCELCAVSATSKEQLEGHMVGQRHMKNVRASAKKASSATQG
ncbi:hypothetical protein SK128_028310 [Halocaridina rubra]|uniref:C2H2-type domain-containing protein n=1 Tax=Halocaridina rubra TaxID=373956 RepID=A0AAN8ZTI1_HALRR